MKTINVIEDYKNILNCTKDGYFVPTFLQIYIYIRFGISGLQEITKDSASTIHGDFIWSNQKEGDEFWSNFLTNFHIKKKCYDINQFFNIPQFENTDCIIHKLYYKVLTAPDSNTVALMSNVLNKLLNKHSKGSYMEYLCFYKEDEERNFTCPCCGKLI